MKSGLWPLSPVVLWGWKSDFALRFHIISSVSSSCLGLRVEGFWLGGSPPTDSGVKNIWGPSHNFPLAVCHVIIIRC